MIKRPIVCDEKIRLGLYCLYSLLSLVGKGVCGLFHNLSSLWSKIWKPSEYRCYSVLSGLLLVDHWMNWSLFFKPQVLCGSQVKQNCIGVCWVCAVTSEITCRVTFSCPATPGLWFPSLRIITSAVWCFSLPYVVLLFITGRDVFHSPCNHLSAASNKASFCFL